MTHPTRNLPVALSILDGRKNDSRNLEKGWRRGRGFIETFVSIVRHLERNCGRCSRAGRTAFFFLGRIVYLVAGYFPPPSSCSSQETLANGVPGNRSIREIFIVFRVRRPVVLQRRTRPRDLWSLSINRKARRARFRCRHRRNVNINPVTRPRFVPVAVTTRDQKLMRFISNPLESFPRV